MVPDKTSFSLICDHSKSLLTGISVNSTFRAVFGLKKLQIIYCGDIIFCDDYKHLTFSDKSYRPEMNFPEKKYLRGL